MFLPYERQITELLQELMHFRAVAVRSQQEGQVCRRIKRDLSGD